MTQEPLSLRRNFVWTFAGNLIYAVCLWGLLAVLTKLGTAETVGRFILASTIASPIMIFAQLQLRSVLAADAHDRFRFQDYLALRLFVLLPALLVTAAVAALFYNAVQAIAIVLFGVGRGVEAVSDILYGYEQKRERLDMVGKSRIIKGVASVVIFGSVFALSRDLNLSLLALAVAWAVPLLVYDLPQCRVLLAGSPRESLRPRWRWAALRQIAWLALPLGGVMVLGQLRYTIPRAGLEAGFGEEALGIFGALSYVVVAGNTVALALSQASLARMGRYCAEGHLDDFRRTMFKLLLLGVGLGTAGVLVAVLAGEPLLRLLYTPAYAAHADLLVLIMVGGGIFYVGSLLGTPAVALGMFQGMLYVQLANTLLMLALAWLLIPAQGMFGAAWTMVWGSVGIVAGYGFLVWRGLRRAVAVASADAPLQPEGGPIDGHL